MSRFLKILLLLNLSLFVASCADDDSSPAVERPSSPPPTISQNGSQCGEVPLPKRPLSYCFKDVAGQATSSKSQVTVVYFFHGLGGNVNEIFNNSSLIFNGLRQMFGDNMPILVSLSLGQAGVMSNEASGIISEALPDIELFAAPGKSVRRVVMGASMGGHNTLRLLAADPTQFKAAAALCPAVATFNGHNDAEVAAYVERNKAVMDLSFFQRALAVYRLELPTAEDWQANNPFTFLEQGTYDNIPIYISVGTEDTLAFFEGTREFKTRSDARPNMKLEYHETRGSHCAFDVPALLDFMLEVAK